MLLASFLALGLAAKVTLPNGATVTGISNSDGSAVFKSIPYGSAGRFESPQFANFSSYDATKYGPGCPQRCKLPTGNCPATQSEDCLSLSVYLPPGSPSKVPVLLWIHGGHYEQGASSTALYDGQFIAKQGGIIVVAGNYRLGVLGFMTTPEGALEGNFGFEDQRLMMKWVQANIAAFGGDPGAVSIAGQSAGAGSVVAHMASPNSDGLFRAGIAESNPWSLPFKTLESNAPFAKRVADGMSCGHEDVSCMKSADLDTLLSAQEEASSHFNLLHPLRVFLPMTPTVGVPQLPLQPFRALETGQWNQVPLMLGHVANETIIFLYEGFPDGPLNKIKYDGFLVDLFGIDGAVEVGARWPEHEFDDNRVTLSELSRYWIFFCSGRYLARKAAATGARVSLYQFDHVFSFSKAAWGSRFAFCEPYTCHGEELPFVWDSAGNAGYQFTAEEQTLSKGMVQAWVNFVKTGGDPGSNWPAYGSGGKNNTMVFTTEGQGSRLIPEGLFEDQCDFFDSNIGYPDPNLRGNK